ncbi:MAG: molybdenum cofactor biosynthesis protein MoaE [Candidatus Melainabacteria bacterium]|nr:molybdenum cofactor biosynthesis protein MoaE [Candidatus Melainabacteria bacterium]
MNKNYFIDITRASIDIEELNKSAEDPECGAVLSFSGTVRNHNFGHKVTKLSYEAYAPMAKKEIEKIIVEIFAMDPGIKKIQAVHRFGEMPVGESSIYLTVSSKHRPEGFLALRTLIDRIKQDVPIWKKEFYEDGESEWLHPDEGCCHKHLCLKSYDMS